MEAEEKRKKEKKRDETQLSVKKTINRKEGGKPGEKGRKKKSKGIGNKL